MLFPLCQRFGKVLVLFIIRTSYLKLRLRETFTFGLDALGECARVSISAFPPLIIVGDPLLAQLRGDASPHIQDGGAELGF